jgi:Protein of unknown function (DUF3501)
VSVDPSGTDQVRTGAAYENDREATRARLSASAEQRRIELPGDLVLVFLTGDSVRTALEELLRAGRVTDSERVNAESSAFGEFAGGHTRLAATLFLDVADPATLGDRLAELTDIAERVSLELGGNCVHARTDQGEDGSGAFHLLFELDTAQRGAVLDGVPLAVAVDHPACRATVALTADQVRAATADLRR